MEDPLIFSDIFNIKNNLIQNFIYGSFLNLYDIFNIKNKGEKMSHSQKAVSSLEKARNKRIREIIKTMKSLLKSQDKKNHVLHITFCKDKVQNLWKILKDYNIPHTEENHNLLIDVVNGILTEGDKTKFKWTEEQFENFVRFE